MDNLQVIQPDAASVQTFGISIPKPFVLSEQDKGDLEKIKTEVMDKVTTWERRIANFSRAYDRGADSWRIKPTTQKKSSKSLFNSKSGETHRAAETLATLWHRMIFGQDPYLEGIADGLNQMGQPVTEQDIYNAEGVLLRQHQAASIKEKYLRSLRSLALMGTLSAELPFTSRPYGQGRKNIEYTDWVFRPMTRVGFDTTVYEIRESDYIFTIDFLSKWMLRNQASLDTEFWDMNLVEQHIKDFENGAPSSASGIQSRLSTSRARAGYIDKDKGIFEIVNYHGRLDPENSVIQRFAESIGLDQDPKYVDWSTSIMDGFEVGKFHMTQYGDWRTRFINKTYKSFEDEPLGYGIAQTGRRLQRDMDINESNTNDMMAAFTHMMYKSGKYGGPDEKQMIWEPLKVLTMEDINQLAPLTPDPNAFKVAMEMINLRREDFRNIVGAQTNLQAQITGASATESAISQTEAIRGAGVHAEVIAEMLREYCEIGHVNNLNYLDTPIWVGLTGTDKPMLVDKNNLPINIGFKIKIVTDKDFRPDRMQKILEALQILTSVRNQIPPQIAVNGTVGLVEEAWRTLGMNPRTLTQPISQLQYMEAMASRLGQGGALPQGGGGPVANENQGQAAGDQAGGGGNVSTPMGMIPTSSAPPTEMSAQGAA